MTLIHFTQKLDDVMKVDLIKDKSVDEITAIWREHFSTMKSVNAIIPSRTYDKMKELFQAHKTVSVAQSQFSI